MSARDRGLGIAIGLVLGIAIVVVFVFAFSADTVDAPSLERGDDAPGQSAPRRAPAADAP